jgi:hypothetical protein
LILQRGLPAFSCVFGFDECLQAGQVCGPEIAMVIEPGVDGAQGFGIELVNAFPAFAMLLDKMGPADAVRAALVKLKRNLPYVDAFGVELAADSGRVFVTADFDFKAASRDVKIEFLPAK